MHKDTSRISNAGQIESRQKDLTWNMRNGESEVDFWVTVKQTILENMPNIIVYIIASLICIQVTKHGKRMIEKQKELSEEKARTE